MDLDIKNKLLIGRSEWCALPDLHIPAIKAKIDTGAKTSAIHAFDIQRFTREEKEWVRFSLYPLRSRTDISVKCEAMMYDERHIMSSNGHKEHRYIILTSLRLGNTIQTIQLSLSNRDPLTFRLLLGREALAKRVLIDPSTPYRQGIYKRADIERLYSKIEID
ncbi:MAG: RimK/LysX family protein [Gammaproteobacteria bacterium]|nr:RimK/LysX family protein [Gammaproteobacteria bacterium]MCD8525566.1 RimK/LysX family protein [Gammaproteobacteria bacterium]MCD8542273.1 RimK/LysX family protein [Gammaproteobacteria bacterium]MCD8573759.1 RimK/LysX family protein [Gammaproteobacteria bacterium]